MDITANRKPKTSQRKTSNPRPTDSAMEFAATSSVSETVSRETVHRLSALYEIFDEVISEKDEQSILQKITDTAAGLLETERAFIAIERNDRLEPAAFHNIELGKDKDNWPVSHSMLKKSMDRLEAILTIDAKVDEEFRSAVSVEMHKIRSVMCCPIGKKGKKIGILYVDSRFKQRVFTNMDLQFLRTLSHLAGTAILNARERMEFLRRTQLAESRLEFLVQEHPKDVKLVGASPAILENLRTARKAAAKNIPIMLVGETGTGKEVFAKYIHSISSQKNGPYIAVNISALSENLVESELFGYKKGAFTDAKGDHPGRFEFAQNGTLFLDEFQDLKPQVQTKLLRVLAEGKFEKVGGNELFPTNAKIICAFNKSPEELLAAGKLRPDLFYRINTIRIDIPPLRERRKDIVPLINFFLKNMSSEKQFEPDALACLIDYSWPGNARQLQSVIQALDVLVDGNTIHAEDLRGILVKKTPENHAVMATDFQPMDAAIVELERVHYKKALELANGKPTKAIELLGVSKDTFFNRKKKYGL